MEGYVKINRLSIISIVCAAVILLIYLLIIVLIWLFPVPPPHISPFYSAAGPLYVLMALALFFLSPVALITGIIALKRVKKGMGSLREKILALISLIIGGIQTALFVAINIIFLS